MKIYKRGVVFTNMSLLSVVALFLRKELKQNQIKLYCWSWLQYEKDFIDGFLIGILKNILQKTFYKTH